MSNDLSRRSLLRGIGLAAFAVPAASFVTGCSTVEPGGGASKAGDLLETAREQGYLRVAIGNEPPYTKMEGDTVTGAEPDVLRAVAKRLGIDDIRGVTTAYESMIPGLQAGRWDVIAAGLFMKQSRCAEVAYTQPVIVSTESFAVPPGNPKGIETIQDILDNPELKVGVLPGAFEEGILKSAGVPKNQWVSVPDGRGGVSAVKAKRADAFLLPTLSLEALAEGDSGFEITGVVEDAPKTGSGAAFKKGSTTMVEEYNKELEEFKKTDEFAEIMTKWGFDPEAAQGVTTEELCENEG
jgi:polar amino acid transport system substrate-binding protein